LPSSKTNNELSKELIDLDELNNPENSENDEDQVKIEDQGNFIVNKSNKASSQNNDESEVKENTKMRHLFYINNIHEDEQDLSHGIHDYLGFEKEESQSNAKMALKMLLLNSTKTLSYNSSQEKQIVFKDTEHNELNSEFSDTYQFTSKDFDGKLGHIKGDTIIYHSIEDTNNEDLEHLLSACLVQDHTQSSITHRDNDSQLIQENKKLKAKILLLNKIISRFREKESKNLMINDLQQKLQFSSEEKQ
jgi:hypothetical protein